jgi:hypothetical protein
MALKFATYYLSLFAVLFALQNCSEIIFIAAATSVEKFRANTRIFIEKIPFYKSFAWTFNRIQIAS